VGADNDVLAAERYAELVEVNGLRLERVGLERVFWCILKHRSVHMESARSKVWMNSYRTTIPDAIRSDDTESEFEKMRDLVSEAHREIRKAVNLCAAVMSAICGGNRPLVLL
jgi:hypothetical protein